MTTFDDQDTELGFFEEPETAESPRRPGRRAIGRGGRSRRPGGPPSGTVAVARLAGLVILAIAIIVGLAAAIGGGTNTHGEYSSYMSAVQPLAQSSARAGSSFASELAASKLTLAGFRAKLEQWSQQEQDDYNRAQQLRPPGRLQAAHQQLLATFQLRAIGLAGLANVLDQKGKNAATVAAQLAAEAQLFSSSDIVWSELYRLPAIQTLKAVGVTGVTVPTSQFVTNPNVISSRSFALVYQRLQPASTGTGSGAGGTVTGLHGESLVGVVASANGGTQTLSTSTPATVTLAQDLAFKVTFEDSGDFPEVNIPVTLTISVGGKTVYTKKQIVPSIESKQQTTVTFGNLQLSNGASLVSRISSIAVAIGKVPGESNVANNSATYEVLFALSGGQ